jgi:PQQ system protein
MVQALLVSLLSLCLTGCEYLRMLRPSVIKQLEPEVVALVNELPEVDRPNKEIVGRLLAHGGLSHASEGADGVMRDVIRIPDGQFIWKPALIVMPRAGELEIEFYNDDSLSHHAALARCGGITNGRRTTSGITPASTRTFSSTRAGASCSRISTATGTSSCSTAPPAGRSRSPRSSRSPGARSTPRAGSP